MSYFDITLMFKVALFLKEGTIFDFQFQNDQKAKNIFVAIFIVLWSYLVTTKLRSLQKNNIGHTNKVGSLLLRIQNNVALDFLIQSLLKKSSSDRISLPITIAKKTTWLFLNT